MAGLLQDMKLLFYQQWDGEESSQQTAVSIQPLTCFENAESRSGSNRNRAGVQLLTSTKNVATLLG
jgi:hypothetical protein